jgi:hypothetical protein
MRVQHPTSPTTELEVKAMLLEDFPAIDKTNFAKVHPASFVLTNLSNRAIVERECFGWSCVKVRL